MPSTYISLCNQVLRRLNEVEISDADFSSVRGVHALTKDAVKAALARINQAEFGWPFNAATHTQTLVAGTEEYSWPDNLKTADFNSFQVLEDANLGSRNSVMGSIDRDEYYRYHRDTDTTSGAAGRGVPTHIYPAHGSAFGVTPTPDKAYKVKFNYFLNYTDLTFYDDVTRVPTSFDSVLVDGALYHMYMFKDNVESSQAAYVAFEQGIKDLQSLYINQFDYIRDTRVRF